MNDYFVPIWRICAAFLNPEGFFFLFDFFFFLVFKDKLNQLECEILCVFIDGC